MFSILERLNVSLGHWFKIPVILHWTWMLMFGFVLVMNPSFAIVYAAVFFIVLLHEFGHCFAGRYYDVHTESITLYPIGGVARMGYAPKTIQELVITIAGPAVNAALIPVLWMAEQYYTSEQLHVVALVNLGMLLFNMLPAFPMDGGRVLRALLVLTLKNYERGTIIAARVGQVFGLIFVAAAFWVGNPWLILVGGFVLVYSQQEIDNLTQRRWVRSLHDYVTGANTQPPVENDVEESARMIEEIQRRISRLRHEE